MMQQGLVLMLIGMSSVFVFLTMLVVGISLLSSAVQQWFPATPAGGDASEITDTELIAVISSAVRRYRDSQGIQQ